MDFWWEIKRVSCSTVCRNTLQLWPPNTYSFQLCMVCSTCIVLLDSLGNFEWSCWISPKKIVQVTSKQVASMTCNVQPYIYFYICIWIFEGMCASWKKKRVNCIYHLWLDCSFCSYILYFRPYVFESANTIHVGNLLDGYRPWKGRFM